MFNLVYIFTGILLFTEVVEVHRLNTLKVQILVQKSLNLTKRCTTSNSLKLKH